MRNALYIILALLLLCMSCVEIDNKGFPDKVKFTNQGGTTVVTGFEEPGPVYIDGSLATEWEVVGDTVIDSYKWLTVKKKIGTTSITIIAEPNESGKNRNLLIVGSFGSEVLEIQVYQKK